jgi:nicotinate phosphoribosyltransferase
MQNKDLYTAIQKLFPLPVCPWDDYFMAMAQTDYLAGRAGAQAAKSFFIRKAPFGGSYALLGGLVEFIRILNEHRFNDECLAILEEQGYRKDFRDYLRHLGGLRHMVNVHAPKEGSIFLPSEPVITIDGDIIACRIAEGMLACVNPSSLFITKWHRVEQAAAPGIAMEFSRRRAQNDLRVSLYARMGGAAITSNADMLKAVSLIVKGTQGHEWIQSWGDEYTAFERWLYFNPDKPVLLVDTINTLASGIPNAIKAYKVHAEKIIKAGGIFGVRFDSGDLAYLALETANIFKKEQITNYKMYMTNDLDEYKIESIKQQIFTNARRLGLEPEEVLNKLVWAAGTLPGTCEDQPSLGGVAKLVEMDGKAVIKIAKDNPIKTSIPGNNRSAFVYKGTELICCMIYHKDENPGAIEKVYHPDDEAMCIDFSKIGRITFEERQQIINLDEYRPSIDEVRNHIKVETSQLHWTHKRFENPHVIKVSLSPKVFYLRQKMIREFKLIED